MFKRSKCSWYCFCKRSLCLVYLLIYLTFGEYKSIYAYCVLIKAKHCQYQDVKLLSYVGVNKESTCMYIY